MKLHEAQRVSLNVSAALNYVACSHCTGIPVVVSFPSRYPLTLLPPFAFKEL